MTEETQTAWQCPKDGTAMQPLGRRSGAWRCPTCRGIFMDTEAMRHRRPPTWSPVLTSVIMSLVARAVARRLRRHPQKPPAP
jgi:tRNA(Ile2) C34 agmatinyltransferase TiaS